MKVPTPYNPGEPGWSFYWSGVTEEVSTYWVTYVSRLELPVCTYYRYFPVPNMRPGSLIFLSTKSPWGRPYFDQVANFFGDIFTMGSLIMTGSLTFPHRMKTVITQK